MSTPSLIADRSYRNYDGPMRTIRAGWWVIAQSVIRTNVRKVGFWVPIFAIILLHLGLGLLFYVLNNTNRIVAQMGSGGDQVKNSFTYASCCYLGVTESWLMVFIEALIIGAGSIAADNQANALLVYLSRPLTKLDYLLGKWVGVFSLLWAASALPTFLLYLFLLTTYWDEGFFKNNPYLLPQIFVAGLIAPALNTSLVLGFSAWSKSGRLAGAAYAGFYFVLATLTRVSGAIMADNAYVMQDNETPGAKTAVVRAMTVEDLSVGGLSDGLTMTLLKVKPRDNPLPLPPRKKRREPPSVPPLLALGGLMFLLPIGAAQLKVRAVEIVNG